MASDSQGPLDCTQFSEGIPLDLSQTSTRSPRSLVTQQLKYVKMEQKKIVTTLKSGNAKSSLKTIRKAYQNTQDALANLGKIILNEKNKIKEEHSQLESTDINSNEGKMVKAAQKVLQQKKLLVALFKVHKQLGAKITSLEKNSTTVSRLKSDSNTTTPQFDFTIPGGHSSTLSQQNINSTQAKSENTFDEHDKTDDTKQTQNLIKSLMMGFSQKTGLGKEENKVLLVDNDILNPSQLLHSPKNIPFCSSPISKQNSCSVLVPMAPLGQLPGLPCHVSSNTQLPIIPKDYSTIKKENIDLTNVCSDTQYESTQSLSFNTTKAIDQTVTSSVTDFQQTVGSIPDIQVTNHMFCKENIMTSRSSELTENLDMHIDIKRLLELKPGKNVLRIKKKGAPKMASIGNDGSIFSSTQKFKSLEEWICSVGKVEILDEAILKKVEYMGTTFWKLLSNSKSQAISEKRQKEQDCPESIDPVPVYEDSPTMCVSQTLSKTPFKSKMQSQNVLYSQSILSCENNLISHDVTVHPTSFADPNVQSHVPGNNILLRKNSVESITNVSQKKKNSKNPDRKTLSEDNSLKNVVLYSDNEFADLGEVLPTTFWDVAGFGSLKLDDNFLKLVGFD